MSMRARPWFLLAGLLVVAPLAAQSAPGEVKSNLKITNGHGGLPLGLLDVEDRFGTSVTNLGDLDGDGLDDLAVGAPLDDGAGSARGAVWILFLRCDGRVRAWQRIGDAAGGFTGSLADGDQFGRSVAGLGDVDGDDVPDLAVGAWFADDGGTDRGAVWVLFLEPDGSVKGQQRISATAGGFTGSLSDNARFGVGAAGLGDLDGDGVPDLAVGSDIWAAGTTDVGRVWILFLDSDGSVRGHALIGDAALGGVLDDQGAFGEDLAGLGDLDGDDVPDLAVGAPADGGQGAVWVLFLGDDGSVAGHQKIGVGVGGFDDVLGTADRFGEGLARLDDLDGDGTDELVVGAPYHDDGGFDLGALWVLFMDTDGTVAAQQKISRTAGHFTGMLSGSDHFSAAVAGVGDLDGDGVAELAVGAEVVLVEVPGRLWLLFLADEVPGPWFAQGDMLAGDASCPRLTGSGALIAGEDVTVAVQGAPPASAAYLLVGFTELDLPCFYGGVLVPSPDIARGPFVTSGTGGLDFTGRWPAGVPGAFAFWLQCWIADPSTPFSYAATNGLGVVVP